MLSCVMCDEWIPIVFVSKGTQTSIIPIYVYVYHQDLADQPSHISKPSIYTTRRTIQRLYQGINP